MRPLELYLHIPFCARKCKYCDFLSAPAERQVQNAYMEALEEEVRVRGEQLAGEEYRVESVFIGGGTPSIVEPARIDGLLQTVRESFRLAADAEITLEANPGTVTREGLGVYRRAGINRLSIGLQSPDDAELKMLGRIHDYGQFLESYRLACEAGFDNINLDLMSALPGQTPEKWERNLQKVLELSPAPSHISAYSLIVEEGTPFYEMRQRGELDLPDEESERQMYWRTAHMLEQAGYEHYEISNYARPGCACRHNIGYWVRTEYLGLGIGAASLLNNMRFSNDASLREYLEHPPECRVDIQELSVRERMEEMMFLGLRMLEGVSAQRFRESFGVALEEVYGSVIEEGVRDGLLKMRDRLFLTPRGIDLSNYIMAKFLHPSI